MPLERTPPPPQPPLTDVWLLAASQTGEGRWLAILRLDGYDDRYELQIRPGPVLEPLVRPANRAFYDYTFDLHRLLQRMQQGERFALPLRLRPRWPTPPDVPALTS